jgi:hypothetical protein
MTRVAPYVMYAWRRNWPITPPAAMNLLAVTGADWL